MEFSTCKQTTTHRLRAAKCRRAARAVIECENKYFYQLENWRHSSAVIISAIDDLELTSELIDYVHWRVDPERLIRSEVRKSINDAIRTINLVILLYGR